MKTQRHPRSSSLLQGIIGRVALLRRVLIVAAFMLTLTACSDQQGSLVGPELGQQPADRTESTITMHSQGASTWHEEWGPEPITIQPPAPCLGDDARVTISGMISGRDKFVEIPTGKLHITVWIDMSMLTATYDGQTWRAGPGAHEIWSFMLAPGAQANQIHVGNSQFVPDGAGPRLKFIHRIHWQVHPDETLETLRDIFEVQCIGSGG